MDEEDTRAYKEPCPQCSEIRWGISDEGKFYCKCCHTIIEKTKEVDDTEISLQHGKLKSISRGLRKQKRDFGWEWYICEGFQFILLKQAESLEDLGIGPDIKDIICNLWRQYLQKTKQAYCRAPTSRQLRVNYESSAASSDPDSDSYAYSNEVASESDMEPSQGSLTFPSSGEQSQQSQESQGSEGFLDASGRPLETSDAESVISGKSGSVDGMPYSKNKGRKMSMPMTLAFCYLSILWVRASVTLSDLLRLVFYRHIPYFNPQQYFPEKTNLYGPDASLFAVQNFPVYDHILELSQDLGVFLKLPQYPPVTETCYFHPNVLCMKYLMEVNLPDELHSWTCSVAKQAGLDEVTVLTFDPTLRQKKLVPYDVQAVAIIIVSLKLVFGLDDDLEWQLAKRAQRKNQEENDVKIFDFQKWYMTTRPCMDEARRKLEEEQARFTWDSERVLAYNMNCRTKILKRRRMEKNLQSRFSKLAGAAPDAGNRGPSSFLFNWEEQNTGKICFHGHSLEGIAQKGKKAFWSLRKKYWLSTVKKCTSDFCQHWKLYDESQFPSSYRFIILLFSTVLRVQPRAIHYQVCLLEEKLVSLIPIPKIKQQKKSKI